MGDIVTIHILPSFNKKGSYGSLPDIPDKLTDSLSPLSDFTIVPHVEQELWKYTKSLANGSKWWMYLYDNEWLSPGLAEALPIYFSISHNDYESYTLTKEVKYHTGTSRYFHTPRIFANYVSIRYGSLMPVLVGRDLRAEFILDGMLYGEFT